MQRVINTTASINRRAAPTIQHGPDDVEQPTVIGADTGPEVNTTTIDEDGENDANDENPDSASTGSSAQENLPGIGTIGEDTLSAALSEDTADNTPRVLQIHMTTILGTENVRINALIVVPAKPGESEGNHQARSIVLNGPFTAYQLSKVIQRVGEW